MTPVNLGQLPSDQPVPTGLCQIKRGASSAQVLVPADNTAMGDNAGNPMRIAITPQRAGWWIIRAQTIFIIGEAAWYYFGWNVTLNPADAAGIVTEAAHHRLHSALSWQQSCIDTACQLNAGVAYTATMQMYYRQGGTIYYWSGPEYTQIMGEFIGEGSL